MLDTGTGETLCQSLHDSLLEGIVLSGRLYVSQVVRDVLVLKGQEQTWVGKVE